LEFDDLLCS